VSPCIEDSVDALKMMDADNNGSIEFNEFVDWYCKAVALESAPTPA
jgi:Ca2+-binding EF-hand superfamily protein